VVQVLGAGQPQLSALFLGDYKNAERDCRLYWDSLYYGHKGVKECGQILIFQDLTPFFLQRARDRVTKACFVVYTRNLKAGRKLKK